MSSRGLKNTKKKHTKDSLKQQYAEFHKLASQSRYINSEVKPLFNEDDGYFNRNNWNSHQDVIRSNLNVVICPDNEIFIEYCDEDHEYQFDYIYSRITFLENQWTILISIVCEELWMYDTFYVTWYKDRGRTDGIYKNGKLMNIDEYADLLNRLEDADYFNGNKWKWSS